MTGERSLQDKRVTEALNGFEEEKKEASVGGKRVTVLVEWERTLRLRTSTMPLGRSGSHTYTGPTPIHDSIYIGMCVPNWGRHTPGLDQGSWLLE